MNKKTLADIFADLEDSGVTIDSFLGGGNVVTAIVGEINQIATVESEYHEYAQGFEDRKYAVTHLLDHDIIVRTAVVIDSYGATSYPYGYGREVKPKEKTIITYEPK